MWLQAGINSSQPEREGKTRLRLQWCMSTLMHCGSLCSIWNAFVFCFMSQDMCVCVCTSMGVRRGNRWKARSLSFSTDTCTVSITPWTDDQVSGTSRKIPALPQLLTVKQDWQATAVTHYSNHRTFKKGKRGGREGWGTGGMEGKDVLLSLMRVRVHPCSLEGNRKMSRSVRISGFLNYYIEIVFQCRNWVLW